MQVQSTNTVPPIAPELLPSALQCEDCRTLQPLTRATCVNPACCSTNLRQVATCCANEGLSL